MNYWKGLKGNIGRNEPLKRHTTFKIGGPARFYAQPKDADDVRLLCSGARKYKLPVLVLGSGSNILASDKGVRAMVIHLNTPYFRKIVFRGARVEAGAGVPLAQLIKKTNAAGLCGLEFLSGIPGTLGGALAMNAGAWGLEIARFTEAVSVMDSKGVIRALSKKRIRFGYRSAHLSGYIVLGVTLKLQKKDGRAFLEKRKKYLNLRKHSSDYSFPSAGCVFKNPRGDSAGRLIDACGLKGEGIGAAAISRKHANFILNRGQATSDNVLQLMRLIRAKVKNKFNITLKPEIRLWK